MISPHHLLLSLFTLGVCLCGIASTARAGAKFSGSTGYEIVKENTAVSLSADYIINSSKENATGTLMVKLWAMDKPYTGGSLGGYLLGSYKLNGLNPGSQYTAPQRIVTYTAPPEKKNYYICLALVEYSASTKGYVIADTRNMPNTALLGPQKKFEMVGPWTWQTSLEGGTIDMNVAKISHHRTGATGSLKLSVWASKEPYDGGTLHGYELGSVSKKALQPGYTYTNVKNVAKYTPPPDGTYFVYLVLFEFGSNEKYEIVSYLSNSKMSTFKKPKQ